MFNLKLQFSVLFLINQLEERNLLFYRIQENGEATLTRSFTCLLWDLIIRTNNDKKSQYYQILDKNKGLDVDKPRNLAKSVTVE